jgi:MerR family transcriptional regulator, light-induced transcriptional regulator
MNSFSIRDIENLCGIKAHTLRIWEQRYNLLCPKRKAGNHRMYDCEDLRYLLRIAYLYHNGHKISTIAKLSEAEVCQLALSQTVSGGSSEIFINHLMEASMDFEPERFDKVLHNIILHMGFEKAITQVVYPFLQKLGLLWLTGNVVPAQEHFVSALIAKKIHVAIHGLDEPVHASGKRVLIYAPKGEFHEIPLLFMRYLMKKSGTPTIYFGKDIPLSDLEFYCARKPVSHLYFHLVTNLLRCEPDQYVAKLSALFPEKQIVISGCLGQCVSSYPNVRILKSLEEMQAFAGEREVEAALPGWRL